MPKSGGYALNWPSCAASSRPAYGCCSPMRCLGCFWRRSGWLGTGDDRGEAMTNDLVPIAAATAVQRQLDAHVLIARWQEGRSPHTVRAYSRDLADFARWSEAIT